MGICRQLSIDGFRYYVYHLSSYGNKTYYLIVQVLLGNVKVFYSIDIKNPNDQTSIQLIWKEKDDNNRKYRTDNWRIELEPL